MAADRGERGGERVGMREDVSAAPVCEHYWAWVSPAGARTSARICMLCHQPDPEWLNHVIEVGRGHEACLHCEFAPRRVAMSEEALRLLSPICSLDHMAAVNEFRQHAENGPTRDLAPEDSGERGGAGE